MPESAPAHFPSGREPARVVAVDDPAADTWRTVARIAAWIALVIASAHIFAILVNLIYDPRSVFGSVSDLRDALGRGIAGNLLLAVLQDWYLLLTATLLVGAVATLCRRRWGPSVLLAYALGMVPGALGSVLLVIVQNVSLRRQNPQMPRPLLLEVVMYTASTLGQLAFPAVLFAIMTRPAVRRQFAPLGPRSAFEPLAAAPASPPGRDPAQR